MNRDRKNRQGGAIIIEATISLTAFLFAIVMILFVSHICYAQAKIGTVIDGAAKDLSEISYIYSLTGLADKHSQMSENAQQAEVRIDSVVDNLSDVTTALGNLKTLGSSVINDSEMQSSMLDLLKNEAANKVESIVTAKIVKTLAKGRLAGKDGDCETVLKNLGVENKNGTYLGSIDFNDSVFCVNGSAEIKVVAKYSVKLITLLNIDITYDIVQCAATKAWGAAKKSDAEVVGGGSDGNGETQTTQPNQTETTQPNQTETTQPETSTLAPIKKAEEYAKDATHNDSAPNVVLGKFNNSHMGQSYIDTTIDFDATYFSMDDYDEIKNRTSEEFMWNINKEFLKQQYEKGKDFRLADNPAKAEGTFKKEVLWLEEHGYSFVYDNGTGFWRAEKNG